MLPVLLALALSAPPPASPPRSITVSGDAKVSFRPNQASVTFLLTASHRDQAGVRRASDEKLGKLLKAVRDAGIAPPNILIADGGPSPEYRGSEVVSYAMVRSVGLTITDLSRLDEALGAALRSGGTTPGAVVLQSTEHATFETRARVAAATVARERAQGLIEALGARLGLPVVVNDRTPVVESLSAGSFTAAADGTVSSAFAAKELSVTSQVTVQFEIEPKS